MAPSQNSGQTMASPILFNSRGRKRSFSELQAGSVDGARPQDAFPTPPDNSNAPFLPIIHPFLEGKGGRWVSHAFRHLPGWRCPVRDQDQLGGVATVPANPCRRFLLDMCSA